MVKRTKLPGKFNTEMKVQEHISIQQEYTQMIKLIHSRISLMGFKRKGNTFIRKFENRYEMIQFQKSMSSTSVLIKFTLNIGILFLEDIEIKNPSYSMCQYYDRIGFLSDQKNDIWFALDSENDINVLSKQILKIMNDVIIPHFYKMRQLKK